MGGLHAGGREDKAGRAGRERAHIQHINMISGHAQLTGAHVHPRHYARGGGHWSPQTMLRMVWAGCGIGLAQNCGNLIESGVVDDKRGGWGGWGEGQATRLATRSSNDSYPGPGPGNRICAAGGGAEGRGVRIARAHVLWHARGSEEGGGRLGGGTC